MPRTRLGALLGRGKVATACMDLSDGLADAVTQLAEASGTGARHRCHRAATAGRGEAMVFSPRPRPNPRRALWR